MLRLLSTMVLLVILCGAILPDPAWARPTVSSWYGPGLGGGLTASGEPFNPGDYTAAHRTLPLNSVVTVCRRGCVDVRINDRGPYVADRELDLSAAAANAIGVSDEGVSVVEVYGA